MPPPDPTVMAEIVLSAIKAAQAPVLARIAVLESRAAVKGLDGATGEIGPVGPAGPQGPAGTVGEPGEKGEAGPSGRDGVDGQNGDRGDRGPEGLAGKDGTQGRDGRDGQPGVQGEKGLDGQHGTDGIHGKDGADGLGFDDLTVEHDGERTFSIKCVRGERVKDLGTFTVPSVIYRGVFTDGTTYAQGDSVTWAGSQWIAKAATRAKPGDGATSWQLAVKAGREGKPGAQGKDGAQGPRGEIGPRWEGNFR